MSTGNILLQLLSVAVISTDLVHKAKTQTTNATCLEEFAWVGVS